MGQRQRLIDTLSHTIAELTVIRGEYRHEKIEATKQYYLLRQQLDAITNRLNAVTLIAEALADLSDERYLMLKKLMPPEEQT